MSKNVEILDKLNEEEQQRSEFPAHSVKISYDPDNYYGQFVLVDNFTREFIPLGNTIEFVPLTEYGRYVRFNSNAGGLDVISNFFKAHEASRAVDKFTGRTIRELKQNDIDRSIKYRLYLFGYIIVDGEMVPACYVLSGVSLKEYLDFHRQKLSTLRKWYGYYAFVISRVKEGKGIVYFKPQFELRELSDAEIDKVVEDLESYIKKIKSYINSVNEAILTAVRDITREAVEEVFGTNKKEENPVDVDTMEGEHTEFEIPKEGEEEDLPF